MCDGLCGHRFHTRCLLELLVKAPRKSTLQCPNCRKNSILLFPDFPGIFPEMIFDRDDAVAHVFAHTAAFMRPPWRFKSLFLQQKDRVFAYLVAHCELELRACVSKLVGDTEETRSWFDGFFENKTGFRQPPCYDHRDPQRILHHEAIRIAVKPLPRRWSRDAGAEDCPDYCGTHALCPGETEHERLFKEGEFVARDDFDPCPFRLADDMARNPVRKEGPYADFRPRRDTSYFLENAVEIYKVLLRPGEHAQPWFRWTRALDTIRLEPAVPEEDARAAAAAMAHHQSSSAAHEPLAAMVRDGLVYNMGALGSVWGHRSALVDVAVPAPYAERYVVRINDQLRQGSREASARERFVAGGEMIQMPNPTVHTAHPRITNPSCTRHWDSDPNEYWCRCVLVTCRIHKNRCRCTYPATIYCRCDSGDCVLHAVPLGICTCLQLCEDPNPVFYSV